MSMFLLLWALPAILACALLLGVVQYKKSRLPTAVIAEASAGLLLASLPFLVVAPLSLPTKILLILFQLWLLVLPARFLFGRLDKEFIYSSTRKNVGWALIFIVISVIFVEITLYFPGIWGDYHWRVSAVLFASLLVGLAFLRQTIWTLKHYKLNNPKENVGFKELPTVSLCIPARNENAALQECLNAALNSAYQKLEILVLDDCSQDKTSEVIKSYAHSGVRFISGDTPAEGWLGKNQAMDTLAAHATGEYIIFASVDTLLQPNSISQLVNYSLANEVQMITVLPQNRIGFRVSTLFGTLQYFWQMVLPITKRHVPVSSKCWIIKHGALKRLGGFGSVRHKIIPEASFARRLSVENKYRFIVSTEVFGVTTAKKWHSQIETSLRLIYPNLKRQPLLALSGLLLIVGLLLSPMVTLAFHITFGLFIDLFWPSLAATILLVGIYALVLVRTHPRTWWLAAFMLPVVLVQEVILIVVSMLAYEFGKVDWKGRNICYPVITAGTKSKPNS